MRYIIIFTFKFQLAMPILFLIIWFLTPVSAQEIDEISALKKSPIIFINPYIENGSRFNWKVGKDGDLWTDTKLNRWFMSFIPTG